MNRNKLIGQKGENLATDYLLKNNFEILDRNYRKGRIEIDIIAKKNKCLYFIEVKTRTNLNYGYPEESVKSQKIANLKTIAEEYSYLHPNFSIKLAIISILLIKGKSPELYFIDDVY